MFDNISEEAIVEAFPWETPRDGQVAAIKFVLDAVREGKKYIVLEGPTGSGKSVIGHTISKFFKNSFYLTIQKALQNQIIADFPDIVSLKGRNAYPCSIYERDYAKLITSGAFTTKALDKIIDDGPDCSKGMCRVVMKSTKCGRCFPNTVKGGELEVLPVGKRFSACDYFEQVNVAINSPHVLMNYSSFMAQTYHAERFAKRDLLICDEAHNIQNVIMDFVSVKFSDFKLQDYGITIPNLKDPSSYAEWIEENGVMKVLDELRVNAKLSGDIDSEDELNELTSRLGNFLISASDPRDEWVSDFEEIPGRRRPYRSVTLRPVYVRHFSNDLLFRYADHTLMMSATILNLNSFCDATGIKKEDVAAYRMKNRIPVSRRPVVVIPAVKATGGEKKMGEWMPKMAAKVDELCNNHQDHRGVIHTHNHAICNALFEQCKVNKRFINQKNFADKQMMIEYLKGTKNGIIVSPGIAEGYDLKGDLARFQIIAKTPFPNYFADKQLARRAEVDFDYINWLTALKMVQQAGRAVRGEDDWAITYVIDSTFVWFKDEAAHMFPKWFLDAITVT